MTIYSKLLKNPLVSTISSHIDTYPTPVNLTYLWSFGSLAGIALVVQIITGVLLAMRYAAEIHLAFASVEHIMRDVKGGVILRYIHANGASMFLLIVYLHMFRGLYYGSYYQPRSNLWYSGIVIFLAMMATAFMGYVLPWGQMSFWGATVITNLFSAIPYIGDSIVQLLWGGFSVDNPTLNRFFSLHYFVPFIIAGLALLHLILLHQPGSNNPLGINAIYDRIPFYPYFYVKDLFGFFIFVWVFSIFVIYAPNYLGHPDNYIEANPLVTPAHIVPEWYFLPFYAILRSIPDKLGGVLLMVIAIVILAILPIADTSLFRSTFFKPLNIWLFWFFFADSICLGWIGQEVVESPFIEMGVFVTFCYFVYFTSLLPLAGFLENTIIKTEMGVLEEELFEEGLNNTLEAFAISRWSLIYVNPILDPFDKYTDRFVIESDFFLDDELLALLNFQWLEFFQVAFVSLFLLSLSLFFSKRGEFTRFINKLSFGYLIFILWRFSFDLSFVSSSKWKLIFYDFSSDIYGGELGPLGKLYHGSTDAKAMLHPFPTRYDYNKVVDSEYLQDAYSWIHLENFFTDDFMFPKLFFIYALLIVSIFLYGVSDRFFIMNGYEIEFSILIFFIHLGALFLFSVQNLIEFVLAIEIVTLATYALTAFDRKNRFSTDAGVQYFILGSLPSGLLVLGVALIYKSWGTLGFSDLDLILTDISQYSNVGEDAEETSYCQLFGLYESIETSGLDFYSWTEDGVDFYVCPELEPLDPDYFNSNNVFPEIEYIFSAAKPYSFATIAAIFLIFFNFLFKITAAPFHFWAPSIYGKAPIASVTFLSIFSKAMIFFAIAKFSLSLFHAYNFLILPFLIFVSLLSVLFGMIGAFSEKGIKRFFVYSSMGHVGFMLLGLGLSTKEGLSATFHYLPVYIMTSFIMWFILLHLGEEKNQLIHFSVLKNTNTMLALIFSLIIFSMSGIPPLGGFFVKLDILAALLESSRFYTNYILLFFTVASFFYYLRVVKIIFFDRNKDYSTVTHSSEERLWMISLLFIILLFYMFLIEKPLLEIQLEALMSLF